MILIENEFSFFCEKKSRFFHFFWWILKFCEKFIFFQKNSIFRRFSFLGIETSFTSNFIIFFSSESWDCILYNARNPLLNAPIFWRVSSFKCTLTNSKSTFRRQNRKMARFSSLWVEMQFWHRNRKGHPIFDLGPPWFKFMTPETTSRDPWTKEPF